MDVPWCTQSVNVMTHPQLHDVARPLKNHAWQHVPPLTAKNHDRVVSRGLMKNMKNLHSDQSWIQTLCCWPKFITSTPACRNSLNHQLGHDWNRRICDVMLMNPGMRKISHTLISDIRNIRNIHAYEMHFYHINQPMTQPTFLDHGHLHYLDRLWWSPNGWGFNMVQYCACSFKFLCVVKTTRWCRSLFC